MKKLFVSLMLMVSCLSFGAKKLYVGTNAEFHPFEYLENGEIVGFDVELMEAIGDKIDKEIVWKNMQFDGLLPALQTGKIDAIIAGMTATEDRKKYVNFSDPYFVTNQMIITNSANPYSAKITSFENLPGHIVGVVLGYTGDIVASETKGVEVQRYNGASEAVMALKAQKVHAVILDSEPAKNYVNSNKGLNLINTNVAKEEYSIAVAKKDKKLAAEINDAYNELVADGTYSKLMKKYFDK